MKDEELYKINKISKKKNEDKMILKTPNQIQSRRFNIKKENDRKNRGTKDGKEISKNLNKNSLEYLNLYMKRSLGQMAQ